MWIPPSSIVFRIPCGLRCGPCVPCRRHGFWRAVLALICGVVAVAGAMLLKPYGVQKMNALEIGLIFPVLGVLIGIAAVLCVSEVIPGSRRPVAPWLLCAIGLPGAGYRIRPAVFGLWDRALRIPGHEVFDRGPAPRASRGGRQRVDLEPRVCSRSGGVRIGEGYRRRAGGGDDVGTSLSELRSTARDGLAYRSPGNQWRGRSAGRAGASSLSETVSGDCVPPAADVYSMSVRNPRGSVCTS